MDRSCVTARVALGAMLVAAGCSLVGVTGPPVSRTTQPLRCTDHHAGTVVDLVIAVPAIVAGGVLASGDTSDNGNSPGPPAPVIGAPLVLVGLVYAASAVVGYRRVEACQAAKVPTPDPGYFCTTSAVSSSTCFCARTAQDCTTRFAAIVAAGGTMTACAPSPTECATARGPAPAPVPHRR